MLRGLLLLEADPDLGPAATTLLLLNALIVTPDLHLRRIKSTRREGNVHTPGQGLQLLVGPEAGALLMTITQLRMATVMPTIIRRSGYPAHHPLLEALVLGPTLISSVLV